MLPLLKGHPVLASPLLVAMCLAPVWLYQSLTGMASITDQVEFLVKLGAGLGGAYSVYKFGLKPTWHHGRAAVAKVQEFGEVIPTLNRIENRQAMQYERHKALINDSTVPHFEANELGAWIWCNDTYRRLVGAIGDEPLGAGWVAAVADGEKFQVYQEWTSAVEQGRDFEKCFRVKTPTGPLCVCAKAYALRGSTGGLAGYFGSVDLAGSHDADAYPTMPPELSQQMLLQHRVLS